MCFEVRTCETGMVSTRGLLALQKENNNNEPVKAGLKLDSAHQTLADARIIRLQTIYAVAVYMALTPMSQVWSFQGQWQQDAQLLYALPLHFTLSATQASNIGIYTPKFQYLARLGQLSLIGSYGSLRHTVSRGEG